MSTSILHRLKMPFCKPADYGLGCVLLYQPITFPFAEIM